METLGQTQTAVGGHSKRCSDQSEGLKAAHLIEHALLLTILVWFVAGVILTSTLAPVYALTVAEQSFFGGSGDETGTGIVVSGGNVYFSGYTGDGLDGIVGQYGTPIGSSPVWTHSWPGTAYSEFFNGVAVDSSGVYTAGGSYLHTTDSVGDKEIKGITVKFNADGSPGGGVAGAAWSIQTPSAPGGFPYGGIEWFTGVAGVSQSGQDVVYTAGFGERIGFTDLWGTFVTKMDAAGNVLWSTYDNTPTRYPTQPAIAASSGAVYMATRSDSSGAHPYVKKYDMDGALLWSRTSTVSGEYLGSTIADGTLFVVGQSGVETANTDFLVECWDADGNLLWSTTYDRNAGNDVLKGVVLVNGHLYAAGSSNGNTSGGSNAVILQIDSTNGNQLDTTLWGGASDEEFTALATDGAYIYANGWTNSLGAGGRDIPLVSFRIEVPEDDSDGDGIPDSEDQCPSSDMRGTIIIDTCETGVGNELLAGGCTMNDLLDQCAVSAGNHGRFVRCVAHITNGWKRADLIAENEKGNVQKCAAKAKIP